MPKLDLTQDDKTALEQNEMLTDRHIHAANTLLRKEFGHLIDGFQSTLLAQNPMQFQSIQGRGTFDYRIALFMLNYYKI